MCVREIFHAAQAATGAAVQVSDATAGQITVQTVAADRDVKDHAIIALLERDALDIGESFDNAFGPGKADRKIVGVVRGRHHHGVGEAVVSKRNRRFLCYADQSPFMDASGAAGCIHRNRYSGNIRITLQRSVHGAVRIAV
jgi:hypothetical protein